MCKQQHIGAVVDGHIGILAHLYVFICGFEYCFNGRFDTVVQGDARESAQDECRAQEIFRFKINARLARYI